MEYRKTILAVAVTVAVSFLAGRADAATRTVCPVGCNFNTIQKAITAAVANDTIAVSAGTYRENVVVTKPLRLQGSTTGVTKIVPAISKPNDCPSGGSICPAPGLTSSVILVQANNVTISNLTVDGDNPNLTTGIPIGGANIDARNGIITDHTPSKKFDNLSVNKVTVQNVFLRGIEASTGGSLSVVDSVVTNVRGNANAIAIYNFGGTGTITHNTVTNANDAIALNHSRGISIVNNTVSNASSGIHTDNAGDTGGTDDLISGNIVQGCSPNGYGIWVYVPTSGPTVTSNEVSDCFVGLAAFGHGVGTTRTMFSANHVDATAPIANSVGVLASTDKFSFGFSDVFASFQGNRITHYTTGLAVDAAKGGLPHVAASFNVIAGNTIGADASPRSPSMPGTTSGVATTARTNLVAIRSRPPRSASPPGSSAASASPPSPPRPGSP